MLALLAPRHEAVAALPRAYRTPLHLRTCQRPARRAGPVLLNWLPASGASAASAELDHRALRGIPGPPALHRATTDGHRRRRAEPRHPARRRPGRRRPGQLPGAVHRRPASRPACGRGAAPPPRRSPRCPAARPEQDPARPRRRAAADARRRPATWSRTLGPHVADLASQIRDADRTWAHRPRAFVTAAPAAGRGHHAAAGRLPATGATAAHARRAPRPPTGSPPAGHPMTRCSPDLHRGPGPAGRVTPVLAASGCPHCAAADRGRRQRRRGREDPSAATPPHVADRRRRSPAAVDPAAAPIRSRRPGRHRPHRGRSSSWPRSPACGPAS